MRRVVTFIAVVLLLAAGCRSGSSERVGRFDIAGGSAATFIVEFTGGEAILRRVIARSRPRSDTRGPRLRPGDPAAGVLGHGEIVVTVYDGDGRRRGAIGVPGRGVDFIESMGTGGQHPNIRGVAVPRSPDVRRVVVPLGPDAASIVFSRVDVIPNGGAPPELPGPARAGSGLSLRDAVDGSDRFVPSSDGVARYRVRPLGAWPIDVTRIDGTLDGGPGGGAWRLDLPRLQGKLDRLAFGRNRAVPREFLQIESRRIRSRGPSARAMPGIAPLEDTRSASIFNLATLVEVDGYTDWDDWLEAWYEYDEPSVEVIHGSDSTDGAETYDIVILGDGFTADELELFTNRAKQLVLELFGDDGWEPFRSRADDIRVHLVAKKSENSGVEHCPSRAACTSADACVPGPACPGYAAADAACEECHTKCDYAADNCLACRADLPAACHDGTSCGSTLDDCRECGVCSGTDPGCDEACPACYECYASCAADCTTAEACSCADIPHDTWLDVRGNSGARCAVSDFAATNEARLWDAASYALPEDEVDLILVIVNCVFYGGRAKLGESIAYVSLMDDTALEPDFTGLAVHEAAHAMAYLGEEYATCALRVPGVEVRNVVDAEAAAGPHVETVWWAKLAHEGELVDGTFQSVVACEDGDAYDAGFGLHWGAQYYDFDDVAKDGWYYGPCDGRDLRLACGTYRPSQKCVMHALAERPCRVCEHVLNEAISAAAAPAAEIY